MQYLFQTWEPVAWDFIVSLFVSLLSLFCKPPTFKDVLERKALKAGLFCLKDSD